MRLAFFFLVLVNLAFHVWSAGYLGGQNSGREPERLKQQLAPEKIRIVAEHSTTSAKSDTKAAIECRRVSGLGAEEAAAVEKTLGATEGLSISAVPLPPAMMHWVLIRYLPGRPVADKKLSELRQLGIDDGRVVNDPQSGPLIISLGVFSSDKGAQEHLATLNKKGVRSAVIETREQAAKKLALDIRGPSELLASLPESLASYSAASLGNCAVGGQQ